MNRAWKGAFLSALVFPGLGQFWLKRYLRGLLLMCAVAVSITMVAAKAARIAMAILEKVEAEGGSVDLVAVADAAGRASATPDDWKTTTALVVITAGWIVGTIDAYLVGRKLDTADRSLRAGEKRENLHDGKGGVSP